ncbi:hypothetical protein [Halopseudomonas salegens]|uniref:Uncharacterized protein n=1 Tax=Halopseudomonas salegens TaxID=1434072 RepID=A0A1H2EID0_9GAMM|nr:hypothetical protein [Halopseudomonas salegens]SDT94840.1 hypothetical protein SAMN05216210_0754 [Halopseudomonas salegens]
MFKFSQLVGVLLVAIALTGCSGFNSAMDVQDDYASSIETTESARFFISQEYNPSITRGMIETTFSASVPAGWYTPVADSAGRTFYQAPEGFEYRAGEKIESRVGGLVQIKAEGHSKFYVWYFPKLLDYLEVQPNGTWIEEVEPGFFNIAARPWVEADLRVESSITSDCGVNVHN